MVLKVVSTGTGGGGSGTVTSVTGNGTVNGITLTGTVTTAGNITLGGTLGNIANSQLSNNSATIGNTVVTLGSTVNNIGNLTLANVTILSGSIPNSAITGLGTMAVQNANAVAITGGVANLTSANLTFNNATSPVGSISVGGNLGGGVSDTGIMGSFVGTANSYVYLVAQNTNNGSAAYTTYTVATNDYTSYANFGINNNAYNNGPNNAFGVAKNAYFYANGGDAVFGTYSNSSVHIIASGSNATSDAITINQNNITTIASLISSNVSITGGSINVTTTNHTANTAANASFTSATMMLIPAGYINLDLNGTLVKIPYYNA
jgi:hypothetical protein